MAKAQANAERTAVLREMNKRKAELAAAAKKEASTAFLKDEELIELLGLTEIRAQYQCKLTRVRYGLDKNKELYFSFNFSIAGGEHEGTPISQFFGIGGKTREEREKKDARICATLQRLNVDTTKWKATDVPQNLVDAADELTKKKPPVILALYTWGDDPDNPRIGIDIVGVGSASKSKASEEEVEEEEQYEEVDEEETEEEADDTDYSEWVGYVCVYETEDGEVTCTTTKWDENQGLFTIEDEGGSEYEAEPSDLTWVDA